MALFFILIYYQIKNKALAFNIVLMEPEIPMNTGNIGRLSLASGANLHLIKPFGFELDNSRLKRAGLDYWPHINLTVYDNAASFFEINENAKMAFLSSHGKQEYYEIDFEDEMFFIFGKESVGLPKDLIAEQEASVYKIPLMSDKVRSINLANAVAIVVYEGIRALKFP